MSKAPVKREKLQDTDDEDIHTSNKMKRMKLNNVNEIDIFVLDVQHICHDMLLKIFRQFKCSLLELLAQYNKAEM